MEILYSPQVTNLQDKKVIFLAGPVRCAEKWQEIVCKYFKNKGYSNYIMVSPIYIGTNKFTPEQHDTQIRWEMAHLEAAADSGYIAFFLSDQMEDDIEQSYARTTRFELGEWYGEIKNRNNVEIIIGYDKKFTGLNYILKKINFLIKDNPSKAKQITVCSDGLASFIKNIENKL